MTAISARGITKRFASFTLSDVGLTLPRGYVMGLVGANGSGKTTTIKCLLGLTRPDAGDVEILPRDRIGVVLDAAPYHASVRVGDVGRAVGRFYPVWHQDRFAERLARAGINPGSKVKELSRGMWSPSASDLASRFGSTASWPAPSRWSQSGC